MATALRACVPVVLSISAPRRQPHSSNCRLRSLVRPARAVHEEGSGWEAVEAPLPQKRPRPPAGPRPSADPDLLEVLELATDDELRDLYCTLHQRSIFSPLLKTLVIEADGGTEEAAPGNRETLITAIDRRLRFLAADSASTLRGRWPAYRQVLLMLRDKLGIACSPNLLTNELEAEVFLHLLKQHGDAVDAAAAKRTKAAAEYASQGDGGAGASTRQEPPNLIQRLLAPLRLGQEVVMPAVARFGSALAVSNLQSAVVQKLGLKLACSQVQYEAALSFALSAGSKGVQGSLTGKVAVQAAKEGITAAAGRYAAARSLLGVLGPIFWASTALELLYVSVGTDWSRIIKAVFALAQIRLLRTYGFSSGNAAGGSMG